MKQRAVSPRGGEPILRGEAAQETRDADPTGLQATAPRSSALSAENRHQPGSTTGQTGFTAAWPVKRVAELFLGRCRCVRCRRRRHVSTVATGNEKGCTDQRQKQIG